MIWGDNTSWQYSFQRGYIMKKILQYLLFVPVIFLMTLVSAQAAGSDISTMAVIIMHLNHYPDSREQEKLAGIVADEHASAGEKVLASALKNMHHSVGGSDAEKLHRLQADASASKQEKELAAILLGITHHPSAADKQKLKSLID